MTGNSRGEIIFYVILGISIIMVNPPILMLINQYAATTPMIFNLPTIWIWLQFWYVVMMASFLIAAIRIKRWSCYQDDKEIVPEERGNR